MCINLIADFTYRPISCKFVVRLLQPTCTILNASLKNLRYDIQIVVQSCGVILCVSYVYTVPPKSLISLQVAVYASIF